MCVCVINTGVDVFGTGQAKVSANGSRIEVWWVSKGLLLWGHHMLIMYFLLSTLEQRAERLFSTKGTLNIC